MQELYFKTSTEWRIWLAENHDTSPGIWLVYLKKESGQPTMTYEESIEEALCFGWVDSIIRKLDDKKYARKFTPRKDNSKWSESNKNRIKKLMSEKRMTEVGLVKVRVAKQNGMWDKPDRPQIPTELPAEFKSALDNNLTAKKNFNELARSYQNHYIAWIAYAKKTATKENRVREAIRLLEKNEKLGLK